MSPDTDQPDRIHHLIELMIHSMQLHHRCIERMMSKSGMHRSQSRMLKFLSTVDHAPSQKEIADRFDISPACVARMLKSLARDGYITRTGSEDDQRRNDVRISEKGLDFVDETRRAFDAFDHGIFRDFTPEEIELMTGLLTRVQQNLQLAEERQIERES